MFNTTMRSFFIYFTLLCMLEEGALGGRDDHGKDEANDSRIVGGKTADKGRYPTVVAMYDKYGFFQCGGNLILPDVVLSAAHCAKVVDKIEYGRFDLLKSVSTEGGISLKIIEKNTHPDYGRSSLYKNDLDVALFKLSSKIPNANTATLNGDPARPTEQGKALTVVGWGTTSEGGKLAGKLQEVEVYYMTNDKCTKDYPAYYGALTGDMMCANVEGGGKDACQGDSGGPIYIMSPDKDPNKDLVVGVVSWGMGCARAEYPGVYARLADPKALGWIEKTACSMTSQQPCELKVHKPSPSTQSSSNSQAKTSFPPPSPPSKYKPKPQVAADVSPSSSSQTVVEFTPDGGCFLNGNELDKGKCAMNEGECYGCGGKWLTGFPACYMQRYGYSSKIQWCADNSSHCQQCGGVYFASPPTLKSVQTGGRRKLRDRLQEEST